MAQHDVEVPVPLFVGHLGDVGVARHPDDVDDAVDAAELGGGIGEQQLDVGTVDGVAREADAVDFGGDVGREVGIDVDDREPRPHGRERVRRLAPDPLPRAEHDEALAVEAQQPRIVGDGGVVGSGHVAVTEASTATSRRSSSGMTSVPSSSIVRMIVSCSRCPNCT